MSNKIKPYGGSSRARLAKLLNSANSTNYQLDVDFTFGPPVKEITESTDTSVTVVGLRKGSISQKVQYRRLSINALAALPAGEVDPVPATRWPFSIHANLATINQALGVNLTTDEVVDDVYQDENQQYLILRITDKSYAWNVSEFSFKITRTIPLNMVWRNQILEGLNAPQKSA